MIIQLYSSTTDQYGELATNVIRPRASAAFISTVSGESVDCAARASICAAALAAADASGLPAGAASATAAKSFKLKPAEVRAVAAVAAVTLAGDFGRPRFPGAAFGEKRVSWVRISQA